MKNLCYQFKLFFRLKIKLHPINSVHLFLKIKTKTIAKINNNIYQVYNSKIIKKQSKKPQQKIQQQSNRLIKMKSNLQTNKSQQQQLQQILKQTFPTTGYIDDDIGQFINDPAGAYHQMFGKSDRVQKIQNKGDRNQKVQRRQSLFSNGSIKSKGSLASSRKRSQQDSQIDGAYKQQFGDRQYSQHKNSLSLQQNNSLQSNKSDNEDKPHQDQLSPEHQHQHQIHQQHKLVPPSYLKLQSYYKTHSRTLTLPQIKQLYPYFIISNPASNYTVTKSYQQNLFQYNTLKSVNITVMDVGFCKIVDNFKIAIGTDDGRVALFQKIYTKPVNIFAAFSAVSNNKKQKNIMKQQQNGDTTAQSCKVLCIKWSPNLQYLAVSSNQKQLKIYQFKQQITIQNKTILRLLKQPIQIISLSQKQLKKQIIQIKFINESPLIVILGDSSDDMQILQYKMHVFSYRTYLRKLQVKFNDVYQVQVCDFVAGMYRDRSNNNNNHNNRMMFNTNQYQQFSKPSTLNSKNKVQAISATNVKQFGTIIAISSSQYVTIALLQPYFEVIMVYDKERHGKNIKKQGYAHISFRKQPLGILIVWDKFAHLLDIQIQTVKPLRSKISSVGAQLLPQTTLLAGLITDTMLYQLSQSGIKIYPTSTFTPQSSPKTTAYRDPIFTHPINFFQLPLGLQIQQHLTQAQSSISLKILHLISPLFKTSSGWLFITSNTSLYSVRVQKFQEFIRAVIQNMNNWKIGLQLLNDAYLGKYYNYDNMTKSNIERILQEYSVKYLNFLQLVIGNGPSSNSSNSNSNSLTLKQKQKENEINSNQDQLWLQQTTFLFNILLQTQQYQHLLNKILPKLASSNLSRYIKCLQPFIFLQKLPVITPQSLHLLYRHLSSKQIISKLLINNIDPCKNQQQLQHNLNQIILQNQQFEEMVAINLGFKDYFTPFVVLISQYQAILSQTNNNNNSNSNSNSNGVKIKSDVQMFAELKLSPRGQSQKSSNKSQSNSQKQQQQSNTNPNTNQQQQQYQKTRLQQLIVYLTYKMLQKINTHEQLPSLNTNTHITTRQLKSHLQQTRQFLQTFLPLFQTRIINICLDSPEQQHSLFRYIIPYLFSGQCLIQINHISNKKYNTDLMTDVITAVPVQRVRKMEEYYMCVIGLYNAGVIKSQVFMGLRCMVRKCKELEKLVQDQDIRANSKQEQYENNDKKSKYMDINAQKSSILKPKQPLKSAISQIKTIRTFIKQTILQSHPKISQQFKKLSPQILKQFYNQLLPPPTNDTLSLYLQFQYRHIQLLILLAVILGQGYYVGVVRAMLVQKEKEKQKEKQQNDKNNAGYRKNSNYNGNRIKNNSVSSRNPQSHLQKTTLPTTQSQPEPQLQPYSPSNNSIFTNIYTFISETITHFSQKQRSQLKTILHENIQYFIELNCQKLCELIINQYLNSIDLFISYSTHSDITNNNMVQVNGYTGIIIGADRNIDSNLNVNNSGIVVSQYLLIILIQNLLHKLNSTKIQNIKLQKFQPHSQWMLGLKLKYLKLLAITGRQHQILAQLKKQSYPLDSSLEICKRYGVIDAQAYLLVKSGGQGQIASAIKLYFKLITQKIKYLTTQSIEQYKNYFISIIHECIKVCLNLHSSLQHFNEQWFKISYQLFEMKTSIYRILPAYTGDLLCNIIDTDIYGILAQKIVKKEYADGIVQYLYGNIDGEDIVFIRVLLQEIIKNYVFQRTMFMLAQESYISSQIRDRKEITKQASQGFITQCICHLCRQQDGIVIHYNSCGHEIHPSCGQDVKICYICAFRQQKMIERQIDLIRKIRPELYGFENQLVPLSNLEEKQKEKKLDMVNRMKMYDDDAISIDYL